MKAHMKTHENSATKYNIQKFCLTKQRHSSNGIDDNEGEIDQEKDVEDALEISC